MTKADKLKMVLIGTKIQDVISHHGHGEVIELQVKDAKGFLHVISFSTYEGTRWEDDGKRGHSVSHDVCVTAGGQLIDED